jgi:hypothetical protein
MGAYMFPPIAASLNLSYASQVAIYDPGGTDEPMSASLVCGNATSRRDVLESASCGAGLQDRRNEHAQIQALNLQETVVLIPGGILEEHGPYLPSYIDGYAIDAYTQE